VLEGDESTFQQQKHDPKKITKPAEEEWNQSNLWLANYAQNSNQTLLLKMYSEHVWHWNRYVRSHRICPVYPETFFSTLILEIRGTKLDETWTQGSPQHKEQIPKEFFFQIQRFSF
jgi:hypothetical protein